MNKFSNAHELFYSLPLWLKDKMVSDPAIPVSITVPCTWYAYALLL